MIILMDTTQKMSKMQLHYYSLLLDLLLSFDSSQLVLTACIGFQSVREMGLQELRKKHKPEIFNCNRGTIGMGILLLLPCGKSKWLLFQF